MYVVLEEPRDAILDDDTIGTPEKAFLGFRGFAMLDVGSQRW